MTPGRTASTSTAGQCSGGGVRCHGSAARALTHSAASTSSASTTATASQHAGSRAPRARRRQTVGALPPARCSHGPQISCSLPQVVVVQALFEPPPFQPSKLSISFSPGTTPAFPDPPQRRYTLTHNDLTGQLWLTVGTAFNSAQISGFYTRLLRDEVIAEWRYATADAPGVPPDLHLYCHVSGEEMWLAPPMLRNYIFRREMPLVLDCVVYAEQELLKRQPHLAQARVFVHFESTVEHLDSVECWGILGERATWQAVPTSILKRVLYRIAGLPLDAGPAPTLQPAQEQPCGLQGLAAASEGLPEAGVLSVSPHSPVVAAAALADVEASASTAGEAATWHEEQQQQRRPEPGEEGHVLPSDAAIGLSESSECVSGFSESTESSSYANGDHGSSLSSSNGNGNGNGDRHPTLVPVNGAVQPSSLPTDDAWLGDKGARQGAGVRVSPVEGDLVVTSTRPMLISRIR